MVPPRKVTLSEEIEIRRTIITTPRLVHPELLNSF